MDGNREWVTGQQVVLTAGSLPQLGASRLVLRLEPSLSPWTSSLLWNEALDRTCTVEYRSEGLLAFCGIRMWWHLGLSGNVCRAKDLRFCLAILMLQNFFLPHVLLE